MNSYACAFLSAGKVHLVGHDGESRVLTSPFAESIQSRAAAIVRRDMWKYSGPSGQMQAGAFQRQAEAVARANVSIAGLCRGPDTDAFLYLVHSEDVRGIFRRTFADLEEQRLFHSNQVLLQDLDYSPLSKRYVCALLNGDGTSSIALLDDRRFTPERATEGDCADSHPRWHPTEEHTVVYQSVGLGRSAAGYIAARAPSEIHRLDLRRGEITTEVSDPKFDLLAPQFSTGGDLFYLKRPRYGEAAHAGFFRSLLDVVRAPFRLAQAVGAWLNYFSMRYTGKTLVDHGGRQAKEQDLRQLLQAANLFTATRSLTAEDREALQKGRYPATWEIHRRTPSGIDTVVATGAGCFSVTANGVIYFDGARLWKQIVDGSKEEICDAKQVEQILAFE